MSEVTTTSGIIIFHDDGGFIGTFTRQVGEPPAVTERNWNQFAEAMWNAGLEPKADDPYVTVTVAGTVTDFYDLRSID